MAGPRMIGIKDVTNPYEGLQESVSRVGDIYQNYEKDRRAAQLHAEQMAEYERKENARQYLNNYTPELGGADFRGIDADTKKAMIREEGEILKSLGPDATPDEYRRVTGEFARRRAQLVTREAVMADVYNDLIRNGVDPAIAQNFANIEGSKYESLEERFKNAASAGASEEERLLKQGELAAKWFNARKPPHSSSNNTSTGGGGGVSAERGTKPFSTAAEAEKYLEGKIGYGWLDGDHKKAIGNINAAINLVNNERKNEKPIGIADISNLIQYSVTTDEWDNDVVYGSTADWKKAIEGYLSNLGNSSGAGSSSGRVVPTAYEEAAVIAALQGVKKDAPTRAEIVAKRVRGVYGDLYKTLKTAEAAEDGGIKILGGTGNSAAGGGTGAGGNSGAGTNTSTDTGAGGRTDTVTSTPGVGDNNVNTDTSKAGDPTKTSSSDVLPPVVVQQKASIQSRIDDIIGKPEETRSEQERLELGRLQSQLTGIKIAEEQLRIAQGNTRATPSTVELPPDLVDRRASLQRMIDDTTNPIVLAGLQSRLGDVEKQEAIFQRLQENPEVTAAAKAAVEAGVGKNIPEELFSFGWESNVNRYPADQLPQLRKDIDSEIANYYAVSNHSAMSGNSYDAAAAGVKIRQLQKVANLIDRKLSTNGEGMPALRTNDTQRVRKPEQVEESEEQTRARVETSYREALERLKALDDRGGSIVPEGTYTLWALSDIIDDQPIGQLPRLKGDIGSELAQYGALLERAELNGDRMAAREARLRMDALQRASTVIDRSLEKARLPKPEAKPDSIVPEGVYTLRTISNLVDEYPVSQLPQLNSDISSELAYYGTLLEQAQRDGNRMAAYEARTRIQKLQKTLDYIDRKVGNTRLPQ